MLVAGTRDIGFAGADWVQELNIDETRIVQVLDTELDPVRIVAASPDINILKKGGLNGRKLIVASEYEQLTRNWLKKIKIDEEAVFLRAYGATESLPPEDADIIVDNAATGSTLKANALEIIDSLMNSTTRLYASKSAWDDPAKRERIQQLVLILQSVLNARKRLMLTCNCTKEKLESILKILPAMKAPTVSALYGEEGFAIQIAAAASSIPTLIPKVIEAGGTDIVVSTIRMLV